MKSLKKLLCIVLSVAMVLGMTAVAFAAEDESQYQEAVDVLKALKVLEGDANGELNLTALVQRDQIAKMIAVLEIGSLNSKLLCAKAQFDVEKDNWAAKYVNYGVAKGYLAGFADGSFHATEGVTGLQLAKILLCALGYNAENEGLVGEKWDYNTSALAVKTGIAKGVKVGYNKLTREEAAQMFLNALQANVVAYAFNGDTFEIANLFIEETIKNDNKLQLAEKLHPLLKKLYETSEKHAWLLRGLLVGRYLGGPEAVEKEIEYKTERTYPLIGLKFAPIDYDNDGTPEFYSLFETESIVLFSDAVDGEFKALAKAHPGDTVYVKANRNTLNPFKYFFNMLPETLSSTTADYETTLEDILLPVGYYEVDADTHKMKYDSDAALVQYFIFEGTGAVATTLAADFENAYDAYMRDSILDALEVLGLDRIELTEVSPATEKEAAIYSFTMPNGPVSGYDFQSGNLDKVTFYNASHYTQKMSYKFGELGDVQEVEIEPHKTLVLGNVPEGSVLYYKTAANAVDLTGKNVFDAFDKNDIQGLDEIFNDKLAITEAGYVRLPFHRIIVDGSRTVVLYNPILRGVAFGAEYYFGN